MSKDDDEHSQAVIKSETVLHPTGVKQFKTRFQRIQIPDGGCVIRFSSLEVLCHGNWEWDPCVRVDQPFLPLETFSNPVCHTHQRSLLPACDSSKSLPRLGCCNFDFHFHERIHCNWFKRVHDSNTRLGMVAPVSQLAHLNRNLPRNELSFCWQWSRSDLPRMSHYFSWKCGPPLHPKPPGPNNNQNVLARAQRIIINYEISQIATLASLVLVVNDATTCFCWTKPSFIDFATVCGRTQMATSANADDELRPKYTIFNQRRSSRVVPTNRIQRSNCLDQWAGGSPLVPQAGSNFHFR